MYNTKHLVILTCFLMTLGLGLFFYKYFWLHLPLQPESQTPVWSVEAELTFNARIPVRASFFLPPDQENFKIIEENFVAGKYGVTTASTPSGRNRISEWTLRNPIGKQTLYYQALIYKINDLSITHGPGISLEKQTRLGGARGAAAKTIIDKTYSASKDSVSLAAGIIKALRSNSDGNTNFLLQGDNSPANVAATAVQVLKGRVAAQVVHGIYLSDNLYRHQVPMETLLRVWDAEKNVWFYLHPDSGKQGLPDGFFIWYYGDSPLLQVEGGSYPQVTLTLSKELKNTLQLANRNELRAQSWMLDYSLFSLPLQTQLVYQILIMIPLGALIVLVMRNIIGISTFGTFMPVLIALAFRETHLLNGILLFSFIVGLGLLVRFYFSQLKLLLIPRLSAVLSTVILLILAISIIGYRLDLSMGLSIAIFPIVIITMTIERMSVVWEEHGAGAAFKQGVGSLASASLAYLAMINPVIEHLFFVFPELILLLMVAMLWLGRYRGYRLSELFRFSTLFDKKTS